VPAPAFDPKAHMAAQRLGWSQAAPGWRRWWQKLEADTVSERLVELADVKQDERVLDVATGIGEPAVTAARRVGSQGRVVATDISSAMLEIARERAAELGLTNIDFLQAAAEELEPPEPGFDIALSRFGLMFFADVSEALRRIRHTLVPGGRFAAAVWGAHVRSALFSAALDVVERELAAPRSPPRAPGTFALAHRGQLEALLRRAGFVNVHSEAIELSTAFASADEYVEYLRETGVTIQNLLAEEREERRSEVWETIRRAVAAHAATGGSLVDRAEVVNVVGTRGRVVDLG
jgi:ubiquinone/menaquinone biosynthesis C-methylase UbiE